VVLALVLVVLGVPVVLALAQHKLPALKPALLLLQLLILSSSPESSLIIFEPTELFNLNLELWGISFLSEPDTMAYSRENFMYITPSVRFKPNRWFSFDLGLDIRLTGADDTSSRLLPAPSKNLNLPNYPGWKLYMQANFQILPTGAVSSRGDVRSRTDFYERLLRDRDKSQNIEDELRRLRREREQAEKELEELRRMLEEEEK